MSKRILGRFSVIGIVVAIAILALGLSERSALADGPGISSVDVARFDCSAFQFYADGTPGGYAVVGIWSNNTPIVDSYVAGYPSLCIPVKQDGSFSSTVHFAPQAPDSNLIMRVYRAPNATAGSFDNQ